MVWFPDETVVKGAVAFLILGSLIAVLTGASTPVGVSGSSYELVIVSQSDLEAQLSYNFININKTAWRVEWEWKSEANRQELLDYRAGRKPLPKWVQKDSADNADRVIVTNGNRLRFSVSEIDETKPSGSLEVSLDTSKGRGEKDEARIGLHSIVIGAPEVTSAVKSPAGRHLVLTDTSCGTVYHAVYIGDTYVNYAQSFDNGTTWLNITNIDNSAAYSVHATKDSNNNLHISVYHQTGNVYYINGTKNGTCGWSFTAPALMASCAATNYHQGGLYTDSYDDMWFACPKTAAVVSNVSIFMCRHTANCSQTANWNATNNSAGFDFLNDGGIGKSVGGVGFVQQDANNMLVSANKGYSTRICHYARQSEGVWVADTLNASACIRISGTELGDDYGSYYPFGDSLVVNSTGAVFALMSLVTPSRTGFSYCVSGCNDSANNWYSLGGTVGYSNLSSGSYGTGTVGMANGLPFAAYLHNASDFAYYYNGSIYLVPTGSTTQQFVAAASNYDTTDFNVIGFLGVNGSAPPYTLQFYDTNFTTTGAGAVTVTISNPANSTYVSFWTGLTFTVAGSEPEYNCSYFYDGAETNIGIVPDSVANFTNVSVSSGHHNLTVFCVNSTVSDYDSVYFTISDHIVNAPAYNSVAYEHAYELFNITVQVVGLSNLTALLEYDGVNYSATATDAGNGSWYFPRYLQPSIELANNTNNPFKYYITFVYPNSTSFTTNSSDYNQTIWWAYYPTNITMASTVVEGDALYPVFYTENKSVAADLAAYIELNGTNTSMSAINYQDFNATLLAPDVNGSITHENFTVTAWFNVTGNGTTRWMNTTSNLSVWLMLLGLCGGNTTVPVFNFTFADEQNTTLFLSESMDATFWVTNSIGSVTTAFSFNFSNVQNATICLSPANTTVFVSSWQEYTATNYPLRFYFLTNASVSTSEQQNITLYSINNSYAASVSVTLKNSSGINIANAIIYAQRYYPESNNWLTVLMTKTDDAGQGNTYLEPNDAWYRFFVVKDNVLSGSFSAQTVPCSTYYCTLTLRFSRSGSEGQEYWDIYDGYATNCHFDNSTNSTVCTLVDSTGLAKYVKLTVWRMDGIAPVLVCNQTNASAIVTLTCPLGDVDGKVFIYAFYTHFATETPIYQAILDFRDTVSTIFGLEGTLVGVFLVLGVTGVAVFSPAAAVIASVITLLVISVIGLFNLAFEALLALLISAAIMAYKMRDT